MMLVYGMLVAVFGTFLAVVAYVVVRFSTPNEKWAATYALIAFIAMIMATSWSIGQIVAHHLSIG